MPDLKSELEKVINAWEHPQPEPQPEIKMETTNTPVTAPAPAAPTVTQILFEYIRSNPGKTTTEIEQSLPQIHPQSISSLLSAMVRRHLVRKTGGKGKRQFGGVYEVSADTYMSPAEQLGLGRGRWLSTKAKRKGEKRAYTRREKPVEPTIPEVVAAQPAPVHAPVPATAPTPMLPNLPTAESVLNNMSVMEARRLYDEMKKLFGA